MATIFWVCWMLAYPICAWFGYAEGVAGARNILAALVLCLHLPIGVVALMVADRIDPKPHKAWTMALRRLCCFPTLGFLIWHGAWIVAAGLALALFMIGAARHDVEKRRAAGHEAT